MRYSFRRSRALAGALVLIALLPACAAPTRPVTTVAQAPTESSAVALLRRASLEDLAKRLPAEQRPLAQTLLTSTDSQKRREAGSELADSPSATEFILALLVGEKDPQVMRYILMSVVWRPHLSGEPRTREVLRYVVDTHPEPVVVSSAVEQLRALSMRELRALVSGRVARERRGGHDALVAGLAPVEDRAVNLDRGLMLPTFLRRSPPVFEKAVRGSPVRILAFGDFGTGSEGQQKAAAAMREYHRAHPFDFGLTLGDNFYPEGLPGPDDPRWTDQFEALYGPMGIEIFACLGNHDEYDPDSPAAQILRSARSRSWRLPAQYYTYTAGPAQFFAIDCNDMSEVQRRWLTDALEESTAAWKVVYGHFPPYVASPGYEGGEFTEFARVIMPILKGRADVYFAGHHHSLQHLKKVDGVSLFIAGGGGAVPYEVDAGSARKEFARSDYGFAAIEITAETFGVTFVDKDSKTLYQTTLAKSGAP